MSDGLDRFVQSVLDLCGGVRNVVSVGHCWSRLRLVLRDPAQADRRALESLEEVLVVDLRADELQLALRAGLLEAHRAVRDALRARAS